MSIKNTIAELFGQSPIRPIQAHAAAILAASEHLQTILQASQSADWDALAKAGASLSERADEARALSKDIRLHLPKSMFMPVPRTDLLSLLSGQGRLVFAIQDVASPILFRKMQFPEALRAPLLALGQTTVAAVAQAVKVIDELDELLEAGFGGPEISLVETLVEELNTIEQDVGLEKVRLMEAIYAAEANTPPVDTIFMYRVAERLALVARAAQKVGDRVLILIAR